MCQENSSSQPKTMPKKAGPLAWIWASFGVVYYAVLIAAIFFSSNLLPTISYFFIAPVSAFVHQRIITAMGAMAHRGILFWMERIGGLQLTFYGDFELLKSKFPSSKLIVSNHQSFTDSVVLYSLAWRMGEIGHMRAFAKKALKSWPVLGGLWTYLNFIFLSRNFQDDAPKIKKQLQALVEKSQHYSTGNFWLMIYPEGTRCKPDKIVEGQKYSESKGLPVYRYSLVPRVKGLQVMLPSIHDAIDAVLDVTIAYTERRPKDGKVIPSVEGLMFGGWRRYDVHAHVRVIPRAEVPREEEQIHDWIMQVFADKDKLLHTFATTGAFPDPLPPNTLPGPSLLAVFLNLFVYVATGVATGAGLAYLSWMGMQQGAQMLA